MHTTGIAKITQSGRERSSAIVGHTIWLFKTPIQWAASIGHHRPNEFVV